ncbi:hypothetical protein KY359_01440 [Candidatus Woesearchaeota archaeon]|nr:hypothetical protein [Candidatus Woesearchaeota archaeon]
MEWKPEADPEKCRMYGWYSRDGQVCYCYGAEVSCPYKDTSLSRVVQRHSSRDVAPGNPDGKTMVAVPRCTLVEMLENESRPSV